jgi:hypothetical protein
MPTHTYRTPLPSAALALYLVYMFRHHKTRFSVHHPLEAALMQRASSFFRHPVDTDAPYGLQICPFGQQAVLALAALLLLRVAAARSGAVSLPLLRCASVVVLSVTAFFSLLNMNAVLYLIPYFVFEGMCLRH